MRLLAAPEVCAGEVYRGRPADMWAMGVSLYTFIYGEQPFQVCRIDWAPPVAHILSNALMRTFEVLLQAESVGELYTVIAAADVQYPSSVSTSNALADLLRRLLCRDPDERITAAQVGKAPFARMKGSAFPDYAEHAVE
jgi:[calcium/calmodulin-dependent protein kinase] kinase